MAQLQFIQHGGLVQPTLVQDDFSRLNAASQAQQLGGFVSIGNGAGGVQQLVQGQVAQQRAQFAAAAQAQPRQQVQYVQAYTADGQPITIAINAASNVGRINGNGLQGVGGHTLLTSGAPQQQFVTASLAQPQAQTLQARHAGMNLISVAPQNNGTPQVFKLVQQQPAGVQATTTLVPNGATILQNGTQRHILVPSNAATAAGRGMPVAVQRFVPSGLQAVTVRQAATPSVITTQQAGIPMGRSLVTMASRPNTVTTYNPTTGMRTNPNVPLTTASLAKPAVQQLQLPSTVLVRPTAGQTNQLQTAGALLQPQPVSTMPQLLQQQPQNLQVKDTAAQQRQQQLLASLRQRVASLHQVQGSAGAVQAGGFPGANTSASGNSGSATPVLLNGGMQMQSDGNNSSASHMAMLQSLVSAQQHKQQEQVRLNNAVLSANQQLVAAQQQQALDGHMMSLTQAQQQALLNDSAAADQLLFAQQQMLFRDALGPDGSLQEFMNSSAMADELRQQARLFSEQQDKAGGQVLNNLTSLDGNTSVQSMPAGKHMTSQTNSLGLSLSADMLEQNQANGESAEKRLSQGQDGSGGGVMSQLRGPTMSPGPVDGMPENAAVTMLGMGALPSAMSTSGEDLRAILSSIGVELARHGIALSTAVEAGWLGVLTAADVGVLEEAYMQEEARLAMNAQKEQMWREALPTADARASNGSPAASVMSGVHKFDHHGSATAGLAPTEGTGDIDDAHFSAFAYDFFGGSMGLGGGADGELLEPLEHAGAALEGGDITSKPSSLSASSAGQFAAAPGRVPSWPSGADASPLGMQAAGESMAAFSDLGQPRTSASASDKDHSPDNASTASSNHELVARIANLDLGCGFY